MSVCACVVQIHVWFDPPDDDGGAPILSYTAYVYADCVIAHRQRHSVRWLKQDIR